MTQSGIGRSFASFSALTLASFCAGCISTEKVEYRDTERTKVQFENDAAGRHFYEAYAKLQSHHDRSESNTHVYLPIIFDHKHKVVEGDNVVFNDAVKRCDTNGDSTITEKEARIFSDSVLSNQQ